MIEFEVSLVEEAVPISQIRQYSTHEGRPLAQRVEIPAGGGWDALSLPFIAPHAEGKETTKELVAGLSPYIRDQIRRFGRYDVNMDEYPPDLNHMQVKIRE